MPALATYAIEQLRRLEEKTLRRIPRAAERTAAVTLERGGRRLISFSCNNYLGLTHHPAVIAAAREALEQYGTVSAASRLVTGSQAGHAELEQALAAWKGHEAGLLFGSGYLANLGIITALMGPGDLILLDKLSHACLIDAAQLSGARFLRFRHNMVDHLAQLLEKYRREYRHLLIVTETVFSMDGDRAPLAALAELAKAHDGWWMADDAHGLGEEIAPKPDLLSGTLSKALGSYGGYVLAEEHVISYLHSSARPFIFSTALPPADIAAARAALTVVEAEPALREKALGNARLFCSRLGLPTPESQIVPLIVGTAEAALTASATLEAAGFAVSAIRPPTVPEGTARLRFTFSAAHAPADVEALARSVEQSGLLEQAAMRFHG